MENYLSNFNDPIYKEYLNKLQYVYSYKVKILKKTKWNKIELNQN